MIAKGLGGLPNVQQGREHASMCTQIISSEILQYRYLPKGMPVFMQKTPGRELQGESVACSTVLYRKINLFHTA